MVDRLHHCRLGTTRQTGTSPVSATPRRNRCRVPACCLRSLIRTVSVYYSKGPPWALLCYSNRVNHKPHHGNHYSLSPCSSAVTLANPAMGQRVEAPARQEAAQLRLEPTAHRRSPRRESQHRAANAARLVQTYYPSPALTGGRIRRCGCAGSTQGTYWYIPNPLYCYTPTGVGGQFPICWNTPPKK